MSVGRRDAERMADLARLRLDEDELERLTLDLNRILDHVRVLQDLAASDEPDEGRLAEQPSTRDVEAERPDGLARALEDFAPDLREGFFIVPPPPGVHDEGEEA